MILPGCMLKKIADASVEPVTVAEAKVFARVSNDLEDDLIATLITSARLECESLCNRSFNTQQWKLVVENNAHRTWGYRGNLGQYGYRDLSITLPRPSLISVESLTYFTPDGTPTVADPSGYRVSTGAPGRIFPVYGSANWFPYSGSHYDWFEVDYTAGYGPTADDVPANVKQAILILTAHYYQNRSADALPPQAVSALLDRERVEIYG